MFLFFKASTLGILLSWFFIRNTRQNTANLYQGLFILVMVLVIIEVLLNHTGYIVYFLPISNYSEPLNFTFGPLFYLYVKRSIETDLNRKDWFHFILAGLWLIYSFFYFLQPEVVKYNSYLYTNHPELELLPEGLTFSQDPIWLRRIVNEMTVVHFLSYADISAFFLNRYSKKLGQSIFRPESELIRRLKNMLVHVFTIIVILILVKVFMGRYLGDYFIAAYISLMIFLTSISILLGSDYFNQPHSILDFPSLKYQKSSLDEEYKIAIAAKITREMEEDSYYTSNMASVSDLAKRVHESTHHVSQVINEQLRMNFFELLAFYRVEAAKKILKDDQAMKITIEELAEEVGYNSKTAFNNAFKKLTGKTPSEFRKL